MRVSETAARRLGLAQIPLVLAGPGAVAQVSAVDDFSPRRALRHFIDSCRQGDYAAAASVLDLGATARGAEEGPRLARQLEFVLDRRIAIDWDTVSDERSIAHACARTPSNAPR